MIWWLLRFFHTLVPRIDHVAVDFDSQDGHRVRACLCGRVFFATEGVDLSRTGADYLRFMRSVHDRAPLDVLFSGPGAQRLEDR